MCKVLRLVLDIQVSWKCKLLKTMLGLDLKFASLYFIFFVFYFSGGMP